MPAPPFYASVSLREDLRTLGHPSPETPALLACHGEQRLDLLRWLARKIDAEASVEDVDQLAHFWNALGARSQPPDPHGIRFPLTATPQRARDRAAASAFLRTCIDLAFAFDGRAHHLSTSTSDREGEEGEADDVAPFSDVDLAMFEQTTSLIQDRHLLFPATTRLLDAAPKRKPLSRRPALGLNKPAKGSSFNKPSQPAAKTQPKRTPLISREKILNQLRTLQRETVELKQALKSTNPDLEIKSDTEEDALPLVEDLGLNDETLPNLQTVSQLTQDASQLCQLFDQFIQFTDNKFAERDARDAIAVCDAKQMHRASELMPLGRQLIENTCDLLTDLQHLKQTAMQLQQASSLLEVLPNSAPVQAVEIQKQRTEGQL
ncbi:hypothetical protein FGB62_271g022 [Gracilaria domingensis]|nr:hypothetical protein FGB62_271g022 [Gracilaria domingensis]